jgi:hypothetical protein
MPDFSPEQLAAGPAADRLVERVLAQAGKRLDVDVTALRNDLEKYRSKHPMVDVHELAVGATKSNRVRASHAAAFSLPAVLPGVGTAAGAVAFAPGLLKLLSECVDTSMKVGLAYGADLGDPDRQLAAVLVVLSVQARSTESWGESGQALREPGGFGVLVRMSPEELARMGRSRDEVITRWVGRVGGPLVTGLAPWGVGAFVASNWIQHVVKECIAIAEGFFAVGGGPQR